MTIKTCFRPPSGNEFKNFILIRFTAPEVDSSVFVPLRGMSLKTNLYSTVGAYGYVKLVFVPLRGMSLKTRL